MAITDWLSLALICIFGAFSPGPSLAVIFAITQINGRASGIMAALGHGLGILLYAFAAATSLSYIIVNYADIFFILQVIGALFLLFLGGKLLKSSFTKTNTEQDKTQNPNTASKGLIGGFTTGFIIAVFNPKIAVFFVSLFSQFLDQDQNLITHIGMAGLAGFIDTAAYLIYVMAFTSSYLSAAINRWQNILERLLGGMLIFLGSSLLISYLV